MKSPVALQPKFEGRAVWGQAETLGQDWRPTEPGLRFEKDRTGGEWRRLRVQNSRELRRYPPAEPRDRRPAIVVPNDLGLFRPHHQPGRVVGPPRIEKGALSCVGWSEDGHRGRGQQHIKSP